jgi:flagellar hook-length control protein FliK
MAASTDLAPKPSAATTPSQPVRGGASPAKTAPPAAAAGDKAPATPAAAPSTSGGETAATKEAGVSAREDDKAAAAPTTPAAPAAAQAADASSFVVQPHPAGPSDTSAATASAPATPVAATAMHPAVEQVAVSLKTAAKTGSSAIQVELNPASLGRIEIRLDFSHDGHVTAAISADRQDTLNLLHSDSHSLEQSLRDTGLHTDSNSLSFNLRGGDTGAGQRQFAQSGSHAMPRPTTTVQNDSGLAIGPVAARYGGLRHDGNLDIQA